MTLSAGVRLDELQELNTLTQNNRRWQLIRYKWLVNSLSFSIFNYFVDSVRLWTSSEGVVCQYSAT